MLVIHRHVTVEFSWLLTLLQALRLNVCEIIEASYLSDFQTTETHSIQLFIVFFFCQSEPCDSSRSVCQGGTSATPAPQLLGACVNLGQRDSHWKCTLWTRRPRQARPLPFVHTHTQDTHHQPGPIFPLNSFTLKMLFCSVWRHTQPRPQGSPADTAHRVVATFQHSLEIQEPVGTTGLNSNVYTSQDIRFQSHIRTLYEYGFTKTNKQKKQTLDHVIWQFPGFFSRVQQADIKSG